jgi:hypothetical protein
MAGPTIGFFQKSLQNYMPIMAFVWLSVLIVTVMIALMFWTWAIGKNEAERISKIYENANLFDAIPFLVLILSIASAAILILTFYPSSKMQFIVYTLSSLLLILGINFLEERLIRKYGVRSGVNDLRRE